MIDSDKPCSSSFYIQLTLADISLVTFMEWVATPEHPDALDAFPKLKAANERFRAQDKIADWLKNRPQTEH